MKLQNDILLRTIRGEEVERPPVWMMRQAGRILPQYRKIRSELSGFRELVKTPELAAEVTIQPVDELGVDAAIIFSDILVIPEAMGLPYELIEKKGPFFPKTIKTAPDIESLRSGATAAAELDYVYKAIKITVDGLNGRVPLIGFCGAPWTILSYMIEGAGSKTFSKARKFLYQEPKLAHQLLEKITLTSIEYLKLKIKSGCSLVQIFDSWAGILSPSLYREFGLPYISKMCDSISEAPKIVFAKGAWFAMEEIGKLNCEVVGLDWNMSPQWSRKQLNTQQILQGNFDPSILYSDEKTIVSETINMINQFKNKHIANLGHGVYPDTPLENVKVFVNTVKDFRYQKTDLPNANHSGLKTNYL
jgi:uroporphyrinogen decarboxylase